MSEFMRRAIAERAERTLAGSTPEQLGDIVGAIHGGGGRASDTGRAFTDLLERRHRRPGDHAPPRTQ